MALIEAAEAFTAGELELSELAEALEREPDDATIDLRYAIRRLMQAPGNPERARELAKATEYERRWWKLQREWAREDGKATS